MSYRVFDILNEQKMKQAKANSEEIEKTFGFNPGLAGNRPRGYWIVEKKKTCEELYWPVPTGYLCIKTRDGGSNDICEVLSKLPNFIYSVEDSFDETYRYYYFKPLSELQ